jgi:hypothetical protein
MGECGCDLRVTRCRDHSDDVVLVLSREEADHIDQALSRAISFAVAFADATPYPDDPRWSPWTRFGKPMADRCDRARRAFRRARAK